LAGYQSRCFALPSDRQAPQDEIERLIRFLDETENHMAIDCEPEEDGDGEDARQANRRRIEPDPWSDGDGGLQAYFPISDLPMVKGCGPVVLLHIGGTVNRNQPLSGEQIDGGPA
jgi:hypothetical protein